MYSITANIIRVCVFITSGKIFVNRFFFTYLSLNYYLLKYVESASLLTNMLFKRHHKSNFGQTASTEQLLKINCAQQFPCFAQIFTSRMQLCQRASRQQFACAAVHSRRPSVMNGGRVRGSCTTRHTNNACKPDRTHCIVALCTLHLIAPGPLIN